MWFETLTGFTEESPEQVRANITVEGTGLISRVNGRRFVCGELETPSLRELRHRVAATAQEFRPITVREVFANVQHLHADVANAGSLFQVASQFNLLEMVSPLEIPEYGVGIYENDRTQGPACAIACGAGTIYRNYFAVVNGQIGQSSTNQIDCLADLAVALGNLEGRLWQMTNGYALATQAGLIELSNRLRTSREEDRDKLRELLRIGLQWDTQVTLQQSQHRVSQAYCSALPVAYSPHPTHLWAEFATLVLEASYEATFCAAILNARKTGNNKLFLTLLGGGAFGNENDWIIRAIRRALGLYQQSGLDVAIVSYRSRKECVQPLLRR
jgi:hypothetical protein